MWEKADHGEQKDVWQLKIVLSRRDVDKETVLMAQSENNTTRNCKERANYSDNLITTIITIFVNI